MNVDQYEMQESHRLLLLKQRLYLMHNLRPTEIFWSTLLAKEVLSQEMLDDIKVGHLASRILLYKNLLRTLSSAAHEASWGLTYHLK